MIGYILALGAAVALAVALGLYLHKKAAAEKAKEARRQARKNARARQEEDDRSRPSKVVESSGQIEPRIRRGRPSVVLLVEDSPTMLLTLRKILERWNYHVISASDGKKAWQELQKGKPDIVVSDIDMPELTGLELLNLMRADLILMDIPVVLITGNPDMHFQATQNSGVDGLLSKPFEDRALIEQIRYILQE